MKRTFFVMIIGLMAFTPAMAQTVKEADPADVSSMDGIMKSVYDVISGDAGKPRDWDRFRSLFANDARLIPVRKDPQTGSFSIQKYTAEEYIQRASGFFAKEG